MQENIQSSYIHTCIHTYIHTYIHTCMHTYIHTYIHTCMHTYIHTYIHTYMHTYIHAYIHTYIHTYINTYLHTYIHSRSINNKKPLYLISIIYSNYKFGHISYRNLCSENVFWVYQLNKIQFTTCLSTVPTPTVTLHSSSIGTPYAGSRFNLCCTIQLNQAVNSPVTVTLFWRRSGVLLSNNTRITVYNVAQNGSHTYLSRVVFSSLSLTLDSGQYTCEASVSASPPSPYITGSPSATSTAYSLTVERPSKLL